jgi:hypothetical protein
MLHSSFPKSPHPLPDAKALTEVKDLCVISHDGTRMPSREVIAPTAEVDTVIVVLGNRLNRQHLHTRVTDVRLQYATSIAPAIRTLSGPCQEDSHHRSYPIFPHRLDRLELSSLGLGIRPASFRIPKIHLASFPYSVTKAAISMRRLNYSKRPLRILERWPVA